jgi:hypothetical protein
MKRKQAMKVPRFDVNAMSRKQVVMFKIDSSIINRKKDEYDDARIGNFRFEPMHDRIVRRCRLMEMYHEEDYAEMKDDDVLNCWSERHNRVKNMMLGRFHDGNVKFKIQDKYAYRMHFRTFVNAYNRMMKLCTMYCMHEEIPSINKDGMYVQWNKSKLQFGISPVSTCELALLEKDLELKYRK